MERKKITLKEIGVKRLIIILLSGVALILLSVPSGFQKKSTPTNEELEKTNMETQKDSDINYTNILEERLQNVLQKVDGIGKTEVMLTLKSSKERVTLKDAPYSEETVNETDSSGGTRISSNINRQEESVLVSGESGGSTPYVIKEIEPEIEGVVVIAQGGGDAAVQSEIIEAVEVLFNVPVHKIKVMKMNVR